MDEIDTMGEPAPIYTNHWFSAHLGIGIYDLWHNQKSDAFPEHRGGPNGTVKKVHYTVVKANSAGPRVVIVNAKDYRVFRIITPELALNLEPIVLRPTVADHLELNALLSKIHKLIA